MEVSLPLLKSCPTCRHKRERCTPFSGGAWFIFRLGHQLISHFHGFCGLCRQDSELFHKLGHVRSLPHHFQFITKIRKSVTMNITNLTLQSYYARCQMRWIQILKGRKSAETNSSAALSTRIGHMGRRGVSALHQCCKDYTIN